MVPPPRVRAGRVLGWADGRLHYARHTAATAPLILGVPERGVAQIMGWSSTAMATRHRHVTGGVLNDGAKRVGGLICRVAEDAGDGEPECPEKGR